MKRNLLTPALTLGILVLTACSHKDHDKKKEMEKQEQAKSTEYRPITNELVAEKAQAWPAASEAAVNQMIAKYSLPSGVTDDMMIWNNSAPFKCSIVFREEVNHQFPIRHNDILFQVVDYRVPKDKVGDLAKFDGSIIVDRTRGEIGARDEKEEMNFLALNLADKIVRGEMTVEEARMEQARGAEALAKGEKNQYLTGINFKIDGPTADPDRMVNPGSDPKMKRTIEAQEVKEVIEEVE